MGKYVGIFCKCVIVCEWFWLVFRVGFDSIVKYVWYMFVEFCCDIFLEFDDS